MSKLSQLRSRFLASQERHDAGDEEAMAVIMGCPKLTNCKNRDRVRIIGRITSVTIPPYPRRRFEAELSDGSGRVTLRWLGRDVVGGIESGRWLIAEGTLVVDHGVQVIFNPAFTLFAAQPEEVARGYAARKADRVRERTQVQLAK